MAMNFSWPPRRWFQYRLRTLLIFVTLCALPCSWLGWKVRQAKREAEAAAAIEKSDAWVKWDADPMGPAWLRSLLGEQCLGHVEGVWFVDPLNGSMREHLYAKILGDAQLVHLGNFANSKRLASTTPLSAMPGWRRSPR